jgi:hypothetical protein
MIRTALAFLGVVVVWAVITALMTIWLLGTVAEAQSVRYAVNPADSTAAVVYGELVINGQAGEACMRLTVLTADPVSPSENSFWCVSTAGDHHCSFYKGGVTYEMPAATP